MRLFPILPRAVLLPISHDGYSIQISGDLIDILLVLILVYIISNDVNDLHICTISSYFFHNIYIYINIYFNIYFNIDIKYEI